MSAFDPKADGPLHTCLISRYHAAVVLGAQMRRREFIGALGAAAVWRISAHAQERVARVGILLIGGAEPMGPVFKALQDLGYVEGRNVQFVMRSAQGEANRLPELAAELVSSKVDIIVASLIAAKNATRNIPIVMAPVGDPVGTGLIVSLARPGGNVTGLSSISADLGSKLLDVVREVLPRARRVAVLGLATDPFSGAFAERIRQDARAVHLDTQPLLVRGADELDDAFAAMKKDQTDAVIVLINAPPPTVPLALNNRIPAFSHHKALAKAGAVVCYSADFSERGREIAEYVDKILKGAKPADLPVQEPDNFELVVNLKSATRLGLTLPRELLARADEVIE
jgi:putative ABC transport system substrate-binding protein